MKSEITDDDRSAREIYRDFLAAAKSVILGEAVSEESLNLVEAICIDEDFFYFHCVSPCEFLGINPETVANKDLEKYEPQDSFPEDLLAGDLVGFSDEISNQDAEYWETPQERQIAIDQKEFGCRQRFSANVFYLAKALWEGEPPPERAFWEREECAYQSVRWNDFIWCEALKVILDAKVVSWDDLSSVVGRIEGIVGTYKDCVDRFHVTRLMIELYYFLGRYDEALELCENLLRLSRTSNVRHPIACCALHIKLKAGIKAGPLNLMNLVLPNEYNVTFDSLNSLAQIAGQYLNDFLDAIIEDERGIPAILEESYDKSYSYDFKVSDLKCLSAMATAVGKETVYPYVKAETESLKDIIYILFEELKFLGRQLRDVRDVEKHWQEEIRIYQEVKKVFPREKIVFHYRTAWLWKFQLTMYLPRLNLAFVYKSDHLLNEKVHPSQSGGIQEYTRLLARTLTKARKKYGMQVEEIDARTGLKTIFDIIESHGGARGS